MYTVVRLNWNMSRYDCSSIARFFKLSQAAHCATIRTSWVGFPRFEATIHDQLIASVCVCLYLCWRERRYIHIHIPFHNCIVRQQQVKCVKQTLCGLTRTITIMYDDHHHLWPTHNQPNNERRSTTSAPSLYVALFYVFLHDIVMVASSCGAFHRRGLYASPLDADVCVRPKLGGFRTETNSLSLYKYMVTLVSMPSTHSIPQRSILT